MNRGEYQHFLLLIAGATLLLGGCKTPEGYRLEADRKAYAIIQSKQQEALGRTEPFTIETPADTLRRRLMLDQHLPHAAGASMNSKDIVPIEQWPDPGYLQPDPDEPPPPWSADPSLVLSLADALQIAARNSRDYQTQKELIFQAALALDLERHQFQSTWTGVLASSVDWDLSTDPSTVGLTETAGFGVAQRLMNGTLLTLNVAVDLVKLLTLDKSSSFGAFGDATIAMPLLRGSGKFVVTEPLTQAERNVVYAIFTFERFKGVFAVQVATDYYAVLQALDEAQNTEENYRWLIGATRRAYRMSEAGRLPEIQVDQARQDELRARDEWLQALQRYRRLLDLFKVSLGVPTDAELALDEAEFDRLAELIQFPAEEPASAAGREPADAPVVIVPPSTEGGPYEMDQRKAITLAIDNRLDLRVALGRIFDAQRQVAVAADTLRAELTLFGNAAVGERRELADAGLRDAELRIDEGEYSVLALLDLPLERTAERNLYRNSLINFEQIVRDLQAQEDQIKFEVRDELRILVESRERVRIQVEAVNLAARRVESTELFLQAGRAEIRDVLEAQEDLLDAKNSLGVERVRYRLSELAFQRDIGLLQVNENGLWTEVPPADLQ